MSLTYHVLLDSCENHHLDRLMAHLAIVRPHYINLTAAARYDQAPDVIRRMRATVPGIRVIWRGWKSDDWKDEGMWQNHTPQEWYNYRVVPHKAFLKEHQVILCADNESGTNDAIGYARWQAEVTELLAADGLQHAALRTSTGTPAESKYADLEVAYRAIAKRGGILSPNEYASNVQSESAGNIARYKLHWAQFDRLGLPRPVTVIGEFAILKTIASAYDGYPTFGMGGEQYGRAAINLDAAWYTPFGVWACLYSFGAWGNGLGVQDDEAFLKVIEDHYRANPNPPISQQPPIVVQPPPPPSSTPVTPPHLSSPAVVRLKGFKGANNVRCGPGLNYQPVGVIRAGDVIVAFQGTVRSGGEYQWIYIRNKDGQVGWIAMLDDVEMLLTGAAPTFGGDFQAINQMMRSTLTSSLANVTAAMDMLSVVRQECQQALQNSQP